MSKVSMPRPRYVAFEATAAFPLSRRAFANALKGRARHEGWADAEGPHLTRYAFPHGIVRVEHSRATACRALLAGITWAVEGGARIDVAVRTVSTSGTLKALTGRTGVLGQRADPAGP
ncbi:MAG TPA: hypothetical protein VM327_01005 [Candidatus Thermoplasmatota archaeon]|nr:hypothetical protein [Candidatus Thermoplasmatota archaeon]